MEWAVFAILFIFIGFLVVVWILISVLNSRHRAETKRLEQKIDSLARKVDGGFGKAESFSPHFSVKELADSGNKLGAIKAYREETGADLATAKNAVEAMMGGSSVKETSTSWESREPFAQPDYGSFGQSGDQSLNQGGPVSSHVGVQISLNGGRQYSLPPEVEQLVRQGQKIQAIKLLREQTNLGLKDAKDLVEVYERQFKQGY